MTLALHTNNVNYAGNTGGTGQPNGAGVPATLIATPSTDSKTWTLTWSGANTEVGSRDQLASLKDGVYDLVIDATKVHPVGSPTVNMAANSTTVFHRLFGDTNAPAQSATISRPFSPATTTSPSGAPSTSRSAAVMCRTWTSTATATSTPATTSPSAPGSTRT